MIEKPRPCHCHPVPEHLWTTHYGAVDPATTHEFNPLCPEHGDYAEAELTPTQRRALALLVDSYESAGFIDGLLSSLRATTSSDRHPAGQ